VSDDLQLAADRLRAWREDPVLFVRDNFGIEPEPWQADYLRRYAKQGKKRIAAQAAVGVGKSAVMSWAGLHFLSCVYDPAKHPGKHPVGYAISISSENLSSGLWKEFAVWLQRSPFLSSQFVWTAEKIFHRAHPGSWWIKARGYSKSATPEVQGSSLSGLHGPYIIGLLDEVGEMHPALGRRAEQLLSDAECEVGSILASGNPTSTTGLLHTIATTGSGWDIVRITGDPDDPMCSARTDKDWAREQIAKYGRDNPWVMAHILGMFPPGGLNTILTPDEVHTAMHRNMRPDQYEWAQPRLGVDVARFGDDRTVIFPRQGSASWLPTIMRNADTNAIAARVAQEVMKYGSELEIIDDTGHWGHGVYDQLKAAGRAPIAVQFHAPALDPRYRNRRTEGWLKMADAIKAGLALPLMPDLIPELTQITYSFDGGKFALEDKEMLKKRLGWSPDIADALACTYMHPEMPRAVAALAPHFQATQFANAAYKPHQRRR